MLERVPHDFFHLPDYTTFAAAHEGGSPRALHVQNGGCDLLLPLVVRPLPENHSTPRRRTVIPGP